MNKLISFFLLLFGLPAFLSAQNINGRFSSSIYTFERFDTANASNTYIRSYQLLSLNVSKDKFTLRSYFNLENELSKKQESDPRLRFYNLYLEGRNLFNIATIKIGRQPIFRSVIGGVFDGANLDLRYKDYKLSGFYGANVPAYQKLEVINDWKDNNIYGGNFTARFLKDFQLDLGFVNKNFRPDNIYTRYDQGTDTIRALIESKSNQFKFASAELSYDMQGVFSLNTEYEYDLNFEKTSKVEFNGRYEQIKNLGLNVYYNYREPRIRYNSIFSVFDFGNTQEIEAGVDYKISDMFTAIGKFGYVTYNDDNSQRFTAGLNSKLGSILYRKNLGYAGEQDALSLYSSYSFMEGLLTPSVGLSFTSYKLSENAEKNNLVSFLAGLNYRPFRVLSFDMQGQYLSNKIYKNDFRFLFKINYWFNTNLNML